jgi:hypothetical protein
MKDQETAPSKGSIYRWSRRRFLITVSAVSGAIGGAALREVTPDLVHAGRALAHLTYRKLRQRRHGLILPEYADVMFPQVTALKFDVGRDHPDVHGPHPDNLDTAREMCDSLGLPVPEGTEPLQDEKGTLIVVGSPTSDAAAREIFGFGAYSRRPPPNPWGLPIVYDHHWRDGVRIFRWLNGEKHRTQRRGICIGSEKPRLVDCDPETGEQRNDYLLITVLPNYHHYESALADQRVWHIGGVHGAGTRAFARIFENKVLAEAFIDRISSALYFQALIKVGRVTHDHDRRISEPEDLDPTICFKPLDRETMLGRAKEWAQRNAGRT